MINHDDAVREFAYDEKDGASLAAARAHGWQVVSMRDDWAVVFAPAGPVMGLHGARHLRFGGQGSSASSFGFSSCQGGPEMPFRSQTTLPARTVSSHSSF